MSDDLVTYIIADASDFKKGVQDAISESKHLKDETENVAKEIAARFKEMGSELATTFGLGFGLERGVEAIKGQIESITELSHLSERTGIDVNNLRALQYEAKHTGTDFENLQGSIKKMQVNLGEAVSGTTKGQAKASILEDLGLDPKSLAEMNPAEAFAKIGDALASIENPTSRVHYAVELFGKAGAESLNVITQGSEGLKAALATIGGISPEEIESLHEAEKGMLALEGAGAKLSRTFAIELAPAIAEVTKNLAELLKKDAEVLKLIAAHKKAIDDEGKEGGTGGKETATGKTKHSKSYLDYLYGGDTSGQINSMADIPINSSTGKRGFTSGEIAEQKKQAKQALEAAKAKELSDQKDDDDYDKLRKRGDKFLRKDPKIQFREDKAEIGDIYEEGGYTAKEYKIAMKEAADEFDKAMKEKDPLKKMKEDAKHLLDNARLPEDKFEDQLKQSSELYQKGVINKDQAYNIRQKAFEELAKGNGLGELFDGKDKFHAPTKIEGPSAITGGSEAYTAFFKGLQPGVDTEQAKQTQLQEKMVKLLEVANTKGKANPITPQVASISP